MQLDGRIALITGAGSGIGRALAVELCRRKARVLLVGRRADMLAETLALLPNPELGAVLPADITNPFGRQSLARSVEAFGRLDLLINNAGIVVSGPLEGSSGAEIGQMLDTNLLAPMELTRTLLPWLRAGAPSRVVNVGSVFGDIAFPFFAAYSATKFALRGWSDALRRELAPMGIGVTYAAPRGTRTPAAEGFAKLAQAFEMRLDPPEVVARQIVDAVAANARSAYPMGAERLFVMLQRLMPGVIDKALGKQLAKAVARLGVVAVLALAAPPAHAQDAAKETPQRIKLDPDRGWYISGKGGPSYAALSGISATGGGSVNDSSGQNVIGAFGMAGGYEWSYRYHIPLRTELEFMNRTEVTYDASPLLLGGGSGALASTVQNITTMAKGYWHFPVGSANWWPFVSGGLGWSHNTVKSQYTPTGGSAIRVTHATDDLAWSAGFGATFKLGPQVMNDVEIRYVDLGKADWGLPAGQNVSTRNIGDVSSTEISFAIRVML